MNHPLSCGWDIIHACNYRCPYCFFLPSWAAHPDENNRRHLACSREEWLGFWERCHEQAGAFQIEVAGGEPCCHPDLIPLLRGVSRRHRLRVVTNLSLDVETVIGVLDPAAVSWSVSFHPTQTSLEALLPKLRRLAAAGFATTASIVAYPESFGALEGWRARIAAAGIPCFLNPFQGTWNGRRYPQSYTPAEADVLGRTALSEAADLRMGRRSPRGLPCAAGRRYLRLWPDGSIYRCCAATELGLGPVGHIRDEKIPLSAVDEPCPAQRCFAPNEAVLLSGV